MTVHPLNRRTALLALALLLTWPLGGVGPSQNAQGAPAVLDTDQLARQLLQEVAVRIEIDAPAERGICTGWVGWSEETRSAVYTAGHCYREGAQYRLVLSNGDALHAIGYARWETLDLMALWIPRGGLRTLRTWKQLPAGPFRALYLLYDKNSQVGPEPSGTGLRLAEIQVARVYWEIHFENHPAAVAIPLYSVPGTSGAPVIDLADSLLVGMIVGYVQERPDLAALLPAYQIYDALLSSNRTPQYRKVPRGPFRARVA